MRTDIWGESSNEASYYGNEWSSKELFVVPILILLCDIGGSVSVPVIKKALDKFFQKYKLLLEDDYDEVSNQYRAPEYRWWDTSQRAVRELRAWNYMEGERNRWTISEAGKEKLTKILATINYDIDDDNCIDNLFNNNDREIFKILGKKIIPYARGRG